MPRGDFRIMETYTRALRSARQLVYLESQFLWSPQVVGILQSKLREPPSDDFRVVVLLPAKPNNGADTTRGQLGVLADADDGAGRFLATTISARSGRLAGALYVHAKIGIVDDAWLTVGSANLNEHSFFNDTEMNVVTCDRAVARQTRLRLWAEHLERSIEEVSGEPARVIDELWRPIAREQLERRRRGEPPTHRLQELPGTSRRSMGLLGPLKLDRRRLTPAIGDRIADPYQSAESHLERSEALEPGPMAMRRQADLLLSHALTGRFLVIAALGHTPRKQSRFSRMPERA